MKASYQTATDVFDQWRDDLLTGAKPARWPVGAEGFDPIELGPGLVLLLGGAPGAGKTALAMQWTLDALRLSPELRALVANVETSPAVLLDRQLARLSGIDLRTIRNRNFGDAHSQRLDIGLTALETAADRLAFLSAPYDLANVAAAADEFGAELLLLDYAQRFTAPGNHADRRSDVNALMNYLRQFAEAGIGCLVLAAVGRTKDKAGRSSYAADGLGLASFRESSELEFGCDSAYMLSRSVSSTGDDGEADLRCLKNRHGEPVDLRLAFDGSLLRFEPMDTGPQPYPELSNDIAALWATTDVAAEGGDE